MEENVKNAIFNYENGFVTKGHMPNENYVPQKMTGDNGIPLNANQLGGTEPLPGDEPQQEGPSLIDSIKDSLEKAADNNYTMQGAFDALTNAGSKWMREQPLYRNIMMSDEEKLLDAQKIGDKVGLNPQLLADNQFLYKEAKDLYDRMEHKAFLDGKDFSANSITELYPEVDLADPVQAAIALKHAREILQSRNVIQGNPSHNLSELGASTWDTVVKSWEAGDAAYESGELQYKAMTGELSNDEVEERLKSLEETEKKYKAAISDSMIATVAGEAIKMGRSMYRMTMKGGEELVEPLGPGVTMALQQFKPILQSAAVYGGATVLGAVGATGAVAGAGIAGAAALVGAVALAKAAVYTGTYRAEAGSAYWDWINKKDAYGNRLYTRDQALGHARRVGHMNAAIETVGLEYAIGGISKVMGPNAAMAVIKNKEALTGLIGAGRKAIAKKSAAYAGKQLARTAAPEILEEGMQQAVGDIDENIFGRGGNSAKDILSGAIDAMMQATPAAVGMALGGAGIAGVGAYRGMRKVATLSKMETAVTEFKRANEKSMNQQLIALRDKSDLYKKSPETYRKTIQSQLEKEGNGTIYIDAQAAAENEATHEALNQMVESGTITSKELDNSIKTGKPLELEAGKYLQTATPETHEALADYSTMDKGERTLHAIKEERQRYKDMIDIVTSTKEKREAAASEKILKDHFSEDTEKGREDRATAQELLSGGLDHLQENYKTLLEEAKKAWGDLSGVKDLQDYMERRKTQDANTSGEKGVDFIDIGEGPDRVHIRESKNPDWYQDFYGDHDRAPTQRELYDVAHQKTIKEVFYKNDEDSHMGTQELEAAKAKVESLERVGEVIKTLDKKDLVAQTLLDPDTYEQAYKPLLEQISKVGNKEVNQAARDSALILAKLAENFHKNYGVPLKLATIKVGEISGIRNEIYGMSAFDVSRTGVTSVSQFIKRINDRKAAGEKPNKIRYTGEYGVSYSEQQVVHATTEHRGHVLTPEQMDDIENHLNVLHDVALSNRGDAQSGKYGGKSVLCRVDGNLSSYYVVLEVNNANGAIWFKTGMAGKKNAIQKIIAEHSAGRLTYKDAGTDSQNNSAITISSLPQMLGIVKNLFQMAGENAETAPTIQLRRAEEMEMAGNTPEEIWNKTGWVRGPEGLWRFEIPDYIENIHLDRLAEDARYIDEIYDNDDLYEAYPELRDTKIRIADTGKEYGEQYANVEGLADGNLIVLNKSHLKTKTERDVKLTILHELQHVIQNTVEPGFSKGGNKQTAKESMRDTLSTLKLALKQESSVSPEAELYVTKYNELMVAAKNWDLKRMETVVPEKEQAEDKLPAELRHDINRRLAQINRLEAAIQEGTDYDAYRKLGGEAESFMIMDRAVEEERRTYYGRHFTEMLDDYYHMFQKLTASEKAELEELHEKEDARDKYVKDPNHSQAESVRMMKEIVMLKRKIPDEQIMKLEKCREAYKQLDSLNKRAPMPAYNSDNEYGYAVVNFNGAELPFMASKEMNKEVHTLSAFRKKMERDLLDGWSPNASKWTDKNGITFKGERIKHAKEKHSLTDEQLDDIEAHIGKLFDVSISGRKKRGQFNGTQIIARIDGNLSSYRVNLNFMPNGTIQFETAFPGKKSAIKKEIANCTPRVLAPNNGVGVPPGKELAISISNIQEQLGIVKKNAYYQTAAPEKDLVAMHNIGLSNLEAAIKLGGFPVPSIAITKKQTPYTGFGDVTLIMNKDTVDPTQTPVFSRDAWTGVFPKTVRVANLKKLQDFMKNVIEPLQRELPRENADYGDLYDSNMLLNVKNKNGDVQRMLESSMDSTGFKYYFLKSINKAPKPKWVKKKLGGTFAEHPTILKACQKLEKKYGKEGLKEFLYEGPYAMLEESPDIKEVNDLLIQETTKESTEGTSAWGKRLRERRRARITNGEELHSLLWDFLKRDEKVFDSRAFETQVSKKVEVNQKAYESWKRSFRNEMLGETVIQDNGKPATLENIVDTMLGKLKNAQTSFAGYGVGNVIASSAKKMNSLKEVHEVADKKMDTSTNTETGLDDSEQYTAVKNKIMDFTNKMADAYKWENKWESYSDAAQVLMAMMHGKSFKVSAKKFDFNYSAELEKQAKEIVKEVKALPVKYFEAKPQRAVRFNEVAAAVMPKNAPKEIKDYLRAQGVMIRLYDPKIDGDRERVTNSAQDRAKQYFQNGTRFQGAYDRNQNVIDIFDGANQSTVIHEGAHMFLSMLEDMSQTDTQTLLQYFNGDEKAANVSMKRMQDDLSTIRNWAAYSEDHLAEYKSTALEKEFAQHAADIAAGKEGAEERWIQERFARGFEKYLMDGSAPTKEMQGVFRRFKKWLTDIYKTAKNLGNVKLTPEIKDVFDKMLATEDEINAWAAQRKLESIDKAIDVNKSELGNLKEWAESVKQKAQEKAMSYYLSMVKEDAIEQFKDSISTEEAKFDFLKSLADENELYSIEQVYNADVYPTKKAREDFLKASGFNSEEELKQKLKESGGTSEEQWQKHIADMVQQYKDEALTPEVIKQMAEDILNSPEGLQKKSRIESMLLEKKVSQYINLVTSMQLKLKRAKDKERVARDIRKRLGLVSEKETSELDKQADTIARSEEKISKLEKQVKTLKEKLEATKKEATDAKGENKSRKESAELLEGNLRAIEAELEKERYAHEKTQATQKDAEATVADLEGQLRTMVEGLRESRKEMWVDKSALKKDAYNTMSLETISHATSWKWWQNKAKEADAKAMKCAADNDWDGAAYYKKVEAQNLIMSRQAKLNVDEIKKALHGGGKLTTKETDNDGMERYGILGLINRIGRKENPVLLQGDARYFIQHLAYMCGMTKNDAPKPIDENGNPRDFNVQALMDMIDPMKMKQLDGAALLADGTDVIPQWVLNTYFNFDSKPGRFGDLTMNDFRDIAKCMKAVYKIGRREYEGNTLGTSFDNAAKEIIDSLHNVSGLQFATSFQRKYLFTDRQKKKHAIAKYVRSLQLPEMYIERLGPAAYKYLYQPIDTATTKQREMKEQATKDIQKIFSTYSRKEWLEIRNDRKYRILDSNELFAKEELLVIALNWGTESNRDRIKDIVREVNPTYDLDKPNWAIDLQEQLETYLTDKDWDFVEKVWTHLNSYYAGRSKVQNDLYGVPMGKVPGITFTLKNGRKIHGQYYTIRYDKDLSQRTSEQSVNDMAKQGMKGATTFGIGMGSTKTRKGSGGQIQDLSLDLYPKFVDEAIQHTTMREATVDVYKLLCRKDVEQSIVSVMGQDGYDFLKQWVVDNWHSPIVEANDWVGFFNRMRCKFNFATMAYRTSTAVLNALNIFPLMNEMGPMNALYAIAHFYKDIPYAPGRVAERYQFIMEKSSFMRGRENNMDRDMAQGMRLPVSKGESKLHSILENGKYGTAEINRYGFWLITKTDLMLSMPQWLATYEGNKRKLQLEHPEMKLEDIDAESVRLADKAVRQTFGSGEVKDRAEIMRNGSWLGQITAFYSYTNLVANWFIRDFYKWKDTGSIRPLAESILFCWILNAVFEGCMRAAWDDKDDDDKYKNKIVNAFFNGGPIGGIPVVRDCLPWIVNYSMTGKGMGEITPEVGALDVLNYVPKIMQATKKGDYIEAARNVSKISNRTYLGFSDTLSDGFWSTVRFCTTENQYTLSDLLYHIIFDKPLKAETKKSKKKEDKK